MIIVLTADRAAIHRIGRLARQGLVWALAAVDDEVFRQPEHQFALPKGSLIKPKAWAGLGKTAGIADERVHRNV